MKKITRLFGFVLFGALLSTSCGKEYASNEYLGRLPMMALDYRHVDTDDNEKADILREFTEEAATIIGKKLPCKIDEGVPLEVAEELTVTGINLDGITYAGKLRVTEDIPVTPATVKQDVFGDIRAKQYVIGLVLYSGDSIISNAGDRLGTLLHHEDVSEDKQDFIDYYFSILERRKYEYDELYKWTERKSLKYVSALAYHDAEKIPVKNVQQPFEGINYWNKGDIIEVTAVIELDHWYEQLSRFSGIRYTLAY